MFARYQINAKLDEQILSALAVLESHESDSEEYVAALGRIDQLKKLKPESRLRPLTPDTVLNVAANIFGILWLASFERENVIKAPRAFGLLIKPK